MGGSSGHGSGSDGGPSQPEPAVRTVTGGSIRRPDSRPRPRIDSAGVSSVPGNTPTAGQDDEPLASIDLTAESAIAVTREVMDLREMRPAKMRCIRRWSRREKAPPRLVARFPWEIVFGFMVGHHRSLILMQMVDRNLRHQLINNHALWVTIFKRHVYRMPYVTKRVHCSEYPSLRLVKSGLTGVPVHTGLVKGDGSKYNFAPDFEEMFTRYVRKTFGLLYGQRCGLCGCRYHHEAYWSLQMRVCKLCMAGNTISSWELFNKYGVHCTDIMRHIAGKVFFFYMPVCTVQDRMSFCAARTVDLTHKRNTLFFWLPHMKSLFDFPQLHRQQQASRASAQLLCAVIKRAWVNRLRSEYAKTGKMGRRSIDNMMMALYRVERRRIAEALKSQMQYDHFTPGGGSWAFSGPSHCGVTRHERIHGESLQSVYNLIDRFEDTCPDGS